MRRLASISLLVALLAPALGLGAELSGRVVRVVDGDTLVLLIAGPGEQKTQEKIRLAGIDAPEKGQPYGQRSKEHLSDQVFGRDVTVDWLKRDRYGRIVGKVLVGGMDADLEQVRAGLAWHYKKYASEQTAEDRAAYARAEDEARAARRGLWREAGQVPPWEWRRR